MAALCASHDGESLLLGDFTGGDNASGTGRVDGDRLLHEDMLSCFNGSFDVKRPEVGRRRDQDNVRVAGHDLAVSVPTPETLVFRNGKLGSEALGRRLKPICSTDPCDLDTQHLGRIIEILRRTITTSATPDQCRLKLFSARLGMRVENGKTSRHCASSNRRSNKTASRHCIRHYVFSRFVCFKMV